MPKPESLNFELNQEQEKLLEVLEDAKTFLKNVFGVEEMTNIELFHLKKIAQEVLEKKKLNKKVNEAIDIPTRWLQEMYEVNVADINVSQSWAGVKKSDRLMEIQKYLRLQRNKQHVPPLDLAA